MEAKDAAPCRHPGAPQEEIVSKVASILEALADDTAYLSARGITSEEYRCALPVAIEKIRGSRAASNSNRRQFLVTLFEQMKLRGLISGFEMPRYGDDTVYRLSIEGFGDVAVIQKGCPDGAHSSVRWSAPKWAKETYLWWLCSSLALEPGEHVVRGTNRLRQRFFSNAEDVLDGVIFHNELCGSPQRPCPKRSRSVIMAGSMVPPPCIYVMPEHRQEGTEWNWDGSRNRFFPSVLLEMFDIPLAESASYIGAIGFQKRGSSIRSTIVSPFGPGRSTNFRS